MAYVQPMDIMAITHLSSGFKTLLGWWSDRGIILHLPVNLFWGSSSSSSSSSSFIFHEPGLHPYATIICISYVEICSHAFMSWPLLQTHVVRNLRGCCLGGSVRCHFLAQGSGVQSVSWTLRELFSVAHVNLAISPYIHLYPMISPWFSQYVAWGFHVFPSEMPILWDQRNF